MAQPVALTSLNSDTTVHVLLAAGEAKTKLHHYGSPLDVLRRHDSTKYALVLIDGSVAEAAATALWPAAWRIVMVATGQVDVNLAYDYAEQLRSTHLVELPDGKQWLTDLLKEHA